MADYERVPGKPDDRRFDREAPPQAKESGEFPKPSARWAAGPARKKLRDEFNTKEIGAVQMMRKYDKDQNGTLDKNELKELLQDWNDKKAPTAEELAFVMLVADKNKDDKISIEEILYALNAWYAFRKMPHSVGQVLTSMKIEDGAELPKQDKVKQLLVKLNENNGVIDEQVAHVCDLITELCGGPGSKIKNTQVRQAVATWYMNIEREETSAGQLGAYALSATSSHVWDRFLGVASQSAASADPAASGSADTGRKSRRKFTEAIDSARAGIEGNAGGVPPALIGVGIVVGVVLVLFPVYLFYVSFAYPVEETCEHNLNSVLFWSILTWFVSLGLTMAPGNIKTVVQCGTIITFCICQVTGFFWSLTSDPENCGRHIFNMCNLVYVILPFITCALSCAAPCCWFCSLCLFHTIQASETDNGAELGGH